MLFEPVLRSTERELIDTPIADTPAARAEYARCVRELDRVGVLLGAHRAGLAVFARWVRRFPRGTALRVLDVGCGGGHFGRRLVARFPSVRVHGIDTEPLAIAAAEASRAGFGAPGARLSYELARGHDLARFAGGYDYAVATLVAHHVPDAELPGFLRGVAGTATRGMLLSDLHRHRLAEGAFALLCRVGVFRSPLVHHDGPASVRRAFVRRDFAEAFARAGLLDHGQLDVRWSVPFRWMVTWTPGAT